MKVLENIRYFGFWIVDYIKGSKIRDHLNDIVFILENYSTSKSKSIRDNYFINILKHAVNTTEYYSVYRNFSDLKDFPIINKNIIRENPLLFQSSSYLNKKNKFISTSGSTGATLQLYHNTNKRLRNTADTIYFSKLGGFRIGYKLLYLRLWDSYLKKHTLSLWFQNIKAINVLNLDDKFIAKFIKQIHKSKSNKGLIGYASAFENICVFLDTTKSKPIQANIKSIIAISESLNSYTKVTLENYFNTPVLSRYSNIENGIIAQQTVSDRHNFKINWAGYYVEILDFDKDEPMPSGETGRIIITDFFNYCMPMIRYDTGDIGAIDYSVTPPVFKKIEGRKMDVILNTKGKIVSSLIMAGVHRFNGIIQSQLIQVDKKEYVLKLNVSESFNSELKIVNEFKNILGEEAKINIMYVDEIPLLDSGKRRATINNYIN